MIKVEANGFTVRLNCNGRVDIYKGDRWIGEGKWSQSCQIIPDEVELPITEEDFEALDEALRKEVSRRRSRAR